MTVSELIVALMQMPQDAEIAVKHRDDGGCYYGCDYDVEPHINDIPENEGGVKVGTVII